MTSYDHDKRPYPIRRAFAVWYLFALAQIGVAVWTATRDPLAGSIAAGVAAAVLIVGLLSIRRAEHDVTPTVDPRDDAGVPFVPIANDAYED